jgi:hypothetical protein
MNRNRIFYSAAVMASPFMVIDFFVYGSGNGFHFILLTAVFNLIYISGWMFSITELFRAKAAGNTLFAKKLFELQLTLFFIANACNIMVMFGANEVSYFSQVCEFFWIVSNIFMTITAIIAINSNNIRDWRKYSMVLAAIWIPMSFIVFKLLRNSMVYSIVIVVYPTLACLLVGYMASASADPAIEEKKCAGRKKYRSQKKYMLAIN